MTAVEFLDKLDQEGLLDKRLVSKLRQQVGESRKSVSAQKIAKLLIDKGHLTAFQAKKLIDDGARSAGITPGKDRAAGAAAAPAAGGGQGNNEELDLLNGDDDLGLEVIEEDAPAASAGLTPLEADGLELIEDDPASPPAPASKPAAEPKKPVKGPVADSGLTPVDEPGGLTPLDSPAGLTPVGDAGLEAIDPLASEPSALDVGATTATKEAAGPKGLKSKAPKVKGQSQWDTPLMLVGGGILILLIVVGIGLYRFYFATSASELFEAATDAYRAQSYTQAISIYEDFLDSYPNDPNAGAAWVRIRIARLRQVVEGNSWERALDTAKEVLKEIDNAIASDTPPVKELPAAFTEYGRPELASLLPDIAAGFAGQAKNARTMEDAEKLVALAEDAMTLVNNPSNIPTSLREAVEVRIDAIQEDIALARRNINRDKTLVQTVGDIDGALGRSDTPAAFELRKALIKSYPDLEGHPWLVEAVGRITEKERELVSLLEEPREPLTEDEPADGGVKVVTAAVNGESAPGVAGNIAPFLARGAVYGLDATTGQVRWRRFVGHETTIHPQPISGEAGADVLLVDGRSNELMRVAAEDGALRWRLPLESAAAAPEPLGERIFVSLESGRLLEVDAETGAVSRQVEFPQPLRSSPAVEEARGLLFQVGEHSNLYVLSSETLDCKAVHYLGHRAGTVVTPPAMSRGQMIIAENQGADYCLLHVLPVTDDLEKLRPSQSPFRTRGNVLAPPFVFDKRIVVVTNLGGINLFEIDAANTKQPVSIVAESLPSLRQPAIGYALAESGQLWVADARLVRYEVQAARGELVRRSIRDESGVYAAPLQKIGSVLLHARRQANSEGVVVTAADAETLRPFWTCEIGAPMVGLAPTAGAALAAVTASGEVFSLTGEAIEAGIEGKARRAADLAADAAFAPPVSLPDGRLAFAGVAEKNRILIFDPQAGDAPPKAVELQVPEGRATAAPVAFHEGLLVPSDAGLVYLADADTGESLALPLRPPMAPGEGIVWQSPVVIAEGNEFVIAGDQGKVYRATLRQQPKPHLAALTEREVDGAIVARLAAAGDTVYGVERSSQEDVLLAFELPSLAFRKIPLDGRLAWGPHEVDGAVLLATHRSLMRLDGGLQPRWTRPLDYGPPVAPPWSAGGEYLFASVGGTVWRVNAETGQESGKTLLGEPLAAGPAVLGAQLVLGGSDGVLHIVPHVTP